MSLTEAQLEGAYVGRWPELFAKSNFAVDLVPDIISTLLNELNLAAFILLSGKNDTVLVLLYLKLAHDLSHECHVVSIVPSNEGVGYLPIPKTVAAPILLDNPLFLKALLLIPFLDVSDSDPYPFHFIDDLFL